MRWTEIICETAFDPQDTTTDRFTSSFVFIDGKFVQAPYQGHSAILAAHFGVPRPDRNDHLAMPKFLDTMQRLIAQHGIVQGSLTRPAPRLRGSMGLVGTLPAIRRAFAAFRQHWPELMAQIDAISYEVLALDGTRVESDFIEGSKIDRKFGRRDQRRPATITERAIRLDASFLIAPAIVRHTHTPAYRT